MNWPHNQRLCATCVEISASLALSRWCANHRVCYQKAWSHAMQLSVAQLGDSVVDFSFLSVMRNPSRISKIDLFYSVIAESNSHLMSHSDHLCSVHGCFTVRLTVGESEKSSTQCGVLPLFQVKRGWIDVEDESEHRRNECEEIEGQYDIS